MPVSTSQSIAAALHWLPPLVGLLSTYVLLLVNRQLGLSVIVGAAVLPALAGHLLTRRAVRRELAAHPRKPGIKPLLRPALLVAVVILGFAHGANDVGTIAGPLSVILSGQGLSAQIGVVPVLVLVCGGFRSQANLSPGQFLVPSNPLVQPIWRPHFFRAQAGSPFGAPLDGPLFSTRSQAGWAHGSA
ncbi:MAG: hypothetical protein ACK4IA_01545 [Paracoccus hibiscisoli]|uniref:hypothetical protein n=1 Tax=Paracoccus hibiscisoli TaxID=2023261 RepID=UPI00391A5234